MQGMININFQIKSKTYFNFTTIINSEWSYRSFEIRDNGELILRSATTINGTLARLVAVASDSGRPPRLVE